MHCHAQLLFACWGSEVRSSCLHRKLFPHGAISVAQEIYLIVHLLPFFPPSGITQCLCLKTHISPANRTIHQHPRGSCVYLLHLFVLLKPPTSPSWIIPSLPTHLKSSTFPIPNSVIPTNRKPFCLPLPGCGIVLCFCLEVGSRHGLTQTTHIL